MPHGPNRSILHFRNSSSKKSRIRYAVFPQKKIMSLILSSSVFVRLWKRKKISSFHVGSTSCCVFLRPHSPDPIPLPSPLPKHFLCSLYIFCIQGFPENPEKIIFREGDKNIYLFSRENLVFFLSLSTSFL